MEKTSKDFTIKKEIEILSELFENFKLESKSKFKNKYEYSYAIFYEKNKENKTNYFKIKKQHTNFYKNLSYIEKEKIEQDFKAEKDIYLNKLNKVKFYINDIYMPIFNGNSNGYLIYCREKLLPEENEIKKLDELRVISKLEYDALEEKQKEVYNEQSINFNKYIKDIRDFGESDEDGFKIFSSKLKEKNEDLQGLDEAEKEKKIKEIWNELSTEEKSAFQRYYNKIIKEYNLLKFLDFCYEKNDTLTVFSSIINKKTIDFPNDIKETVIKFLRLIYYLKEQSFEKDNSTDTESEVKSLNDLQSITCDESENNDLQKLFNDLTKNEKAKYQYLSLKNKEVYKEALEDLMTNFVESKPNYFDPKKIFTNEKDNNFSEKTNEAIKKNIKFEILSYLSSQK